MMKMMKTTSLLLLGFSLLICESAQALIVAATLPASRSVQVGSQAGVFATMINGGSSTATNCRVALASPADVDFYYQVTDPLTNAVVGSPDTPVDIEPGQAVSFVLGLTANSPLGPTEISFNFVCDNDGPAPITSGLNTLLFSASDEPVPDVIALSATVSANGIVELPQDNQFGFFAVATINLGRTATIRITTVTMGAAVDNALVCETDPVTAVCITDLLPEIETVVTAGATPTFGVFLSSQDAVAFDPAANRLVVTFSEAGFVRGSTSVAIEGGGSSVPYVDSGCL